MRRRFLIALALIAAAWPALLRSAPFDWRSGLAERREAAQPAPGSVRVIRFASNPLVTVKSSPSLGANVNGPTIIRVPSWIPKRLGAYYMYFANHRGDFIRLAYADAVTGPWKIHEPGVWHVRESALNRPQPDSARFGGFNTHFASPEIFVDHANRRVVLWAHGWYTNGEHWPTEPKAAQQWANERGYGQFTQGAVSSDGLTFTAQPAITKESYIRVFERGGALFGMARLGVLIRADNPLAAFTIGPNAFRDTAYKTTRVRHVALVPRGDRLYVFFTAIGDAPERMLLSTIDMTKDWSEWRASAPIDVMQPDMDYECGRLPATPSAVGDILEPARQIRDPHVFADEGKTYLFYAICGEQGIAGAELALP